MGEMKYIKDVRIFFKKTPVVNSKDIALIVKNKNYAYLLVSNLIKKGEIKRITKGFYTIYEDPVLVVFCFRPAYIGLQEALSIHNLWEQETNTVVVTTKKLRVGVREIFGSNVLLRRINPKYFFGYELIKYGNFYIPVSDVEKTLIDMIHFNEILNKETLKEIKKRINTEKLSEYLEIYPEKFKKRVLGVLFNKK